MNAWKKSSGYEATEVIAEAVRLHGRARGWHIAARLLGVSERTVRGITYGETSGATIPTETAMHARATLRRQRAAELRAAGANWRMPLRTMLLIRLARLWGWAGDRCLDAEQWCLRKLRRQ